MINTMTLAATLVASLALSIAGVQARDWSRSQQEHRERSDHIAPQVNGYGSYDRGQYRTAPDSFRNDNRSGGGFSAGEGSGFLFKGREQ